MNKNDSLDTVIRDMNKALPLGGMKRIESDITPIENKPVKRGRPKKIDEAVDHKRLEAIKEVEAYEEALIEPYSRKHKPGVKLIDERMRSILIRLAGKYYFYKVICAKAGIYEQRLNEELARNENFRLAFAHARYKFIAHHQALLIQYAKEKREKAWQAEKYILTICDKEFSERKYLTDAVANQDAKILMLIKAEQLTVAGKQGKDMLKNAKTTPLQKEELISLLPFKPEDPKNKLKPKKRKNKGQSTTSPPVE